MVKPITFLRETQDELKKVTWPTRAETVRLTFVVLAISVLVGLYVGGIDFALTKIIERIVK